MIRSPKNPRREKSNMEKAREAVTENANLIIATLFLVLGFVLGRI